MNTTTLPTILINMPMAETIITDGLLEQFQQQFPGYQLHVVSARATHEIPTDIWQHTEILATLGHLLPDPEQAPRLRWVHLHSAGADVATRQPLYKTDVIFTTSSGVHSINIAEFVLAAILSWYHEFARMYQGQQQKNWIEMQHFQIDELHGKTLGIVGYGSIGREIARQARAFGTRILATQRNTDHRDHGFLFPGIGDPEGTIPERYYPIEQLHALLQESDIVVAAVPLTDSTRQLFNEAAFKAMKRHAYFINIARGEVCDENALIQALSEQWIAGATLDVFEQEPLPAESPLWSLPNVFLTPHISGWTPHYTQRTLAIFTENLRRYQAHAPQTMYNLVDKQHGY
ncbi:D-2-hydroxyacid dehydrogenase [Dictyobacter arantiisoli]|uniref:3-phosphoglycerate dehydrogenase n=1 Tax=Dictyobacter arantiisoli TaxID=2014874 RepID=A0A5A5TDU3_9CHLR|nr:D-2-hydroxyacid dehydrogenase [Dictyobacter arantiisoli]GCF09366.1 3-phosphoglycerate dehydrogenase [Dictyobacter arantiisoli]